MAVRREESRAIYRFDEFQLDARKRVLLRDGKPVTLNAKAFQLLLVLVESGGRQLSKDELMQSVWQDQAVEENNLAVHIYNLRKILGERKDEHRYIVTIPGVGYRFVGDVREATVEPEELFIESRAVSRLIVEEDIVKAENPAAIDGISAAAVDVTSGIDPALLAATSPPARPHQSVLPAITLVGLLLTAAIGVYWFYQTRSQTAFSPAPEPRRQITLTRVTNDGHIEGTAISPDGKYVAYVLGESDGYSLWLRQVGTASDIPLLPSTEAEFWGLTFSPDGRFIYYNLFAGGNVDFELFRVPSLGGVVEKIPNVSTRAITFSPDGERIAYIQTNSGADFNSLVVAGADGENQQVLARRDYPNTFYSDGQAVAWSPDGKIIACLVTQFEADANYITVVGVNTMDGAKTPLSARRWYEISGIAWMKNGAGLLIAAKDTLSAPTQVWSLPYPKGESRQLTNDLNQYSWLSLTADGEALAAIQANTVNAIFVGEMGGSDFKEINAEVGELNPLAWTPDGKIVFRSSKDGAANLWLMNADGTGRRQLTTNSQVDSRGLCVSPDGKHIVFVSWRSGKSNLWRVDVDGSNLTQLTDGDADAYPRCTQDGSSVIFQRGIFTKPMLWKVSLAGGAAERVAEFRAKWAAVSNDGSRISYFQMDNEKWRLGIISLAGAGVLQRLDVPADLKNSTVFWSPDNGALLYIGATGNIGNIRSLPLDGSSGKSLTAFTADWLSDFAVSSDGKRLAVTRSRSLSDVVLLTPVPSP